MSHISIFLSTKELRGAIEANAMTTDDVYAELGELVNGTKAGRENDDELIVVDLTGTGAQDAAIGQVCTTTENYLTISCAILIILNTPLRPPSPPTSHVLTRLPGTS